ncbi:hypothetical protein [Magnetofaba australis]|uniref:Uncharacterized protein n=1 Tax=Magnetofaba australis IT-1 TaxID=1434232 RepID=A0A1Y2K910_9PROT|nr:hypothetical protein [Magnetofaba australis]OSM06946.1 hypothetical protein MAIT1_00166 [Magnetofaba australis IT-1]
MFDAIAMVLCGAFLLLMLFKYLPELITDVSRQQLFDIRNALFLSCARGEFVPLGHPLHQQLRRVANGMIRMSSTRALFVPLLFIAFNWRMLRGIGREESERESEIMAGLTDEQRTQAERVRTDLLRVFILPHVLFTPTGLILLLLGIVFGLLLKLLGLSMYVKRIASRVADAVAGVASDAATLKRPA